MSLEKHLIGIQRFNGTEFHIWEWQICNLFCAKGCIQHIDGTVVYDFDEKK